MTYEEFTRYNEYLDKLLALQQSGVKVTHEINDVVRVLHDHMFPKQDADDSINVDDVSTWLLMQTNDVCIASSSASAIANIDRMSKQLLPGSWLRFDDRFACVIKSNIEWITVAYMPTGDDEYVMFRDLPLRNDQILKHLTKWAHTLLERKLVDANELILADRVRAYLLSKI